MPEIENGLLDLEQRTRRAPAPRHPKRPVEIPPAPAAAPVPPRAAAEPVVRSTAPLRATQIYLDEESDDFLRRCGAAGLIQGSRDVTNSGVIRYLLAKAAAESAPDEIARALLDNSASLRRPGRRRT